MAGDPAVALTLLLVDDEAKMLDFMASYFRREGFDVITAMTGSEALRLAQSAKPAVVVLDWMLPEMSGIDVCRELRRTSRRASSW